MRKEEMIARYTELYDRMSRSEDIRNMRTFGEAERTVFGELATNYPDIAGRWLERLEPIDWDNYISEREVQIIARSIVNQDGSTGFRWSGDAFFNAVRTLGGKAEERPKYNRYALLVTSNMVYSDHARSIAQDMGEQTAADVPNEKMVLSCYRKAVELLEDPDGGFRIRDYFRSVLDQNQQQG